MVVFTKPRMLALGVAAAYISAPLAAVGVALAHGQGPGQIWDAIKNFPNGAEMLAPSEALKAPIIRLDKESFAPHSPEKQ